MADLQSQDYIRGSASTMTPPSIRNHEQEVAKLIDVTRCIGCKACQAACMEWNNLRNDIGYFEGTYDNPLDLNPNTWTVMRFTEWEDDKGNLEWLIRKDGCMHCEDPGCLKACPAPGAIVQYANGIVDFISDNCIGCGYCVKGCPFDIPRVSPVDHKSYKCTLVLRPRHRRAGARLRQGLPDRAPSCSVPRPIWRLGGRPDRRTQVARLRECRALRSARRERHACHVCSAPCGPAFALCRVAGQAADQHFRRSSGRAASSRSLWRASRFAAISGFFHWITAGPNEVQPHDEEEAAKLLETSDTAQMTYPEGTIIRNTTITRINHWISGLCFVLLMLSGLAMFHPLLFFLSESIRRRPMDARGPSVDRHRPAFQLYRADHPILARQSMEQGRHRLDARHRSRPRQRGRRRPRSRTLQRRPKIRLLVDGAFGARPVLSPAS